jgi:phenylalanine-4-hydroxylase
LEKNTWIGCNTQNFLHIEQAYQQYPMTVIPETSVYDYFSTEKSVWPALLGKLFLIFGSTGCMKYIQRFYDIDLSEFLNLEFDSMDSYYDQKLDCMLESNKNFILNSHKFYNQNYQRIHNARSTMGPNLYRFVLDQVSRIQ